MPFFNEASRIYTPAEVSLLRSCFSSSAIFLEEGDHGYSAQELASCIITLYERGLRDPSKLAELAARLANKKYESRNATKLSVEESPFLPTKVSLLRG